MKYLVRVMTVSLLLMVSMSVTAQKTMEIGFKSIKEIFKESDCNYCSKAYHFVNSVKRIKADVKRLVGLKSKKRGKITKRLSSRLKTFTESSSEQWRGLSIELQNSGTNSEASRQTIRLQLHLESIQETLYAPEFGAIETIRESLDRIGDLQKQIKKTLNN